MAENDLAPNVSIKTPGTESVGVFNNHSSGNDLMLVILFIVGETSVAPSQVLDFSRLLTLERANLMKIPLAALSHGALDVSAVKYETLLCRIMRNKQCFTCNPH